MKQNEDDLSRRFTAKKLDDNDSTRIINHPNFYNVWMS